MAAATVIRGSGIAALTCARLLADAGYPVTMQQTGRADIPAILLGETTQKLIRDVFGDCEWMASLPRIERRVVAWGPDARADAGAVTVPHSAVVISEQALIERLRPQLRSGECAGTVWTFIASKPLPAGVREHGFGTRRATALPVRLRDDRDRGACWIESLPNGWLFLLSEWLLAVGAPAEELLGRSRLVADRIRDFGEPGATFPVYPRIAEPLGGTGWLAGGSAALAFDPLCGDGAGHAIREAILASAIIRAAAGADPGDLLAHYQARLVGAFRRHLEVCRHYYSTGGATEWWRGELEAIEKGITWCGCDAPFRFQLAGFELRSAV